MKLLFLYVENYGALKDFQINFDSSKRFRFDNRRLECIEDGSAIRLTPDFFSVSTNGDKHVVESISAIVGENGSGKSTVARAIGSVFAWWVEDFKFVAVMDFGNDDIRVFYNLGKTQDGKFVEIETSPNCPHKHHPECCGQRNHPPVSFFPSAKMLIYYSPVYTSQRIFEEEVSNNVFDLSTTGLMLSRKRKFLNPSAQDRYHVEQSVAFNYYETKECLELIQKFNSDGFSINHDSEIIPRGCAIGCNTDVAGLNCLYFKRLKKELEDGIQNKTPKHEILIEQNIDIAYIQKCYALAVDVVDNKSLDPAVCFFVCYVGCYLRDNSIDFKKKSQYDLYGESLLKFCKTLVEKGSKEINWQTRFDEIIEFFKTKIRELNAGEMDVYGRTEDLIKTAGKGIAVFQAIKDLVISVISDNPDEETRFKMDRILYVPLNDKTALLQNLLNLVRCHAELGNITSFIVFRFFPVLSSGEMSYLSMWSRLWGCIEQFRKEDSHAIRHAIIFLDEAETMLHPNWQRQLVKNTIRFLEAYASDFRVHLIFGSHSPILLSDIPKSNVVFLGKDAKTRQTITMGIDESVFRNTFGANIFDLYKLSFFMDDGPMGVFAREKIDKLLNDVKTEFIEKDGVEVRKDRGEVKASVSKEDELVARLIGDPFISNYIWNRYEKMALRMRNEAN